MNLENDLNIALVSNLKLKAKIMAFLFGAIFIVQILVIPFLYSKTDFFSTLSMGFILIGPFLILAACLLEIYALKYFTRSSKTNKPVSQNFLYLTTFSEISFPTLLMGFAGLFLGKTEYLQTSFLLASPPSLIYFILIILSSFTLDKKLCIFSGLVAAIQYVAISLYFLSYNSHQFTETPNNIIKGVLMLVCGIVAGVVSKRIKDAVVSSLKSRNDLIFKLDQLVEEKTNEIHLQKEELLEKNKDITDSIHYAKRIQRALFPTEKYIQKQIEKRSEKIG